MPGTYNPFLFNPAWLDAAYIQYGWPDYLRQRTTTLPQPVHQSPLIKGTQPLVPPPQQPADFCMPPTQNFHSQPFLPPNGSYLPQLSELTKIPTLNLRTIPPQMDPLRVRLSPSSNSLNNDSRVNSTVDQSQSENSEDEDEIDVVKSAFQPIKPANLLLKEVQHPDSTVQEESLRKCELKAPSSKMNVRVSPISRPSPKISPASSPDSESLESRLLESSLFESKTLESRTLESRTLDSKIHESRTHEPRTLEPRTLESRILESRSLESKLLESRSLESKLLESRLLESRTFDPRTLESRLFDTKIEPRLPDSRTIESMLDSRSIESRLLESRTPESRSPPNSIPTSISPPSSRLSPTIEYLPSSKLTVSPKSLSPKSPSTKILHNNNTRQNVWRPY